MTEEQTGVDESRRVKLDPVLDLRAAVPLADQFRAMCGVEVFVDASEVERVGAQCVQVLLAAKKTWDDAGDRFELLQPSSQFRGGLETLGLDLSNFQHAESTT